MVPSNVPINGDAKFRGEPYTNSLTHTVTASFSLSSSPVATYTSPSPGKAGPLLARTGTGSSVKQLKPFATEDIKILLLENINKTGRDVLTAQGYQVEYLKSSLPEDELIEKIRWGIQIFYRIRKILG